MIPITLDQYLGAYKGRVTPEAEANAVLLLPKINAGLQAAEDDGIVLEVNPNTGCYIAGNGNGGVRPEDSHVGAHRSAHKRGRAIDPYDPHRTLASWSLRNQVALVALGILAVENPRWTPTWCHWQDEALPSGNFVFIPSATPPLAEALPEQQNLA